MLRTKLGEQPHKLSQSTATFPRKPFAVSGERQVLAGKRRCGNVELRKLTSLYFSYILHNQVSFTEVAAVDLGFAGVDVVGENTRPTTVLEAEPDETNTGKKFRKPHAQESTSRAYRHWLEALHLDDMQIFFLEGLLRFRQGAYVVPKFVDSLRAERFLIIVIAVI